MSTSPVTSSSSKNISNSSTQPTIYTAIAPMFGDTRSIYCSRKDLDRVSRPNMKALLDRIGDLEDQVPLSQDEKERREWRTHIGASSDEENEKDPSYQIPKRNRVSKISLIVKKKQVKANSNSGPNCVNSKSIKIQGNVSDFEANDTEVNEIRICEGNVQGGPGPLDDSDIENNYILPIERKRKYDRLYRKNERGIKEKLKRIYSEV